MPVVLGNLRAIGPVIVDYRNPSLSWSSAPTSHGIQPCTISGSVGMATGHQLTEMVNNPSAQTTVGGYTGVLEWVEMDGDALALKEGYYLLQSFDLNVERDLVYAGRVGFTLTAAYLGGLA